MGIVRKTQRSAVPLVIAALILSACTDDSQNQPPAPQSSQQPTPQLRFDQEPLWRGDDRRVLRLDQYLSTARFIGNSLLLEGQGSSGVAVVDPVSGEPRWTTGPTKRAGGRGIELFAGETTPVTDESAAWHVLLAYNDRTSGELASGIAAVDGAAGQVKWKARLDDTPAWSTDRFLLLDADDDLAISWFTSTTASSGKPMTPMALATNVADGSTRWQAKGVWPQFVAAGRVLGVTASRPPELIDEGDDGYVTALDARTGKPQWNLKDRYSKSRMVAVAGDAALIAAATGGDDAAVVIDAESGRELAKLGDGSCGTDERRLIACVVFDHDSSSWRIIGFDVDKRDNQMSHAIPADSARGEVSAVWGDYIFLGDSSTGYRALDRNGKLVADDLPGRLVAMSDSYAVFRDLEGQDPGKYAVYRVQQ